MPSYAKSAAAGLAAGLVAAAAMELFGRVAAPRAGGDDEPATVKAADGIAVAVTGQHLPESLKAPAGEAVHFVTGAALGLGYGVLVALAPQLKAGFGTGYGLAASALLGGSLAETAPAATGGNSPAKGALSNLVVGAVLEGVRQVIVDAGEKKGG